MKRKLNFILSFMIGLIFAPIGLCWFLPHHYQATKEYGTRNVLVPTPRHAFTSTLLLSSASGDSSITDTDDSSISGVPKEIVSPVLRQVYPKLLEHVNEFGNPNIPLGTSEGRQCETLRRLRIQNKLTDAEVDILTELGFLWHDLEDVYRTADFDDLYERLLKYRDEHDGDISPPKKYNPDPELGAWVTGLRRLGPDQVDPVHRAKLDDLGFEWVSQRKCGSSFMKQYRAIVQQLQESDDPNTVWEQEVNQKWIRAQQMALQRNDLAETRQHYLEQILGPNWANIETK